MATSRFRSWPITSVKALEPALRAMGLRVPASAIDGTSPESSEPCLSDALVSVGPAGRGGTGSFVSDEGLIITNHHVALDAIRQVSTAEKDYLKNGFVASSRADEVAGPDYEVWITRSCADVSASLAAVNAEPDPLERSKRVAERRQEIAREAESAAAAAAGSAAAASSVRCEVQEMWAGRVYVLFTYERLRDVRLVYAPPSCLGGFGGDTDNFEWPRHSADFTLLRAYVSPDGGAAEPHPSNVPFRPSRHLRVNASGASAGDFVFLLGFPGSTMRYAPASRLAYTDSVAVPRMVDDFGTKLRLISMHSTDRKAALKMATAKKSLSNEHKRSFGKRVMMRKLGLVAEREAEEAALRSAAADAGPILDRLSSIYDGLRASESTSYVFECLRGVYHGSALLAVGFHAHEASVEAAKPEGEREPAYHARNLPFLVKRLAKRLHDLHPPHEAALLRHAAAATAGFEGFRAVGESLAAAADAVEAGELPPTAALTSAGLEEVLRGSAAPPDDALVRASSQFYPAYAKERDATRAALSERDLLLASLLEIQKANAPPGEEFYPDANGCLRLSAGHVEGYAAADAVRHEPITTLAGLVDKHVEHKLASGGAGEEGGGGGGGEFECPQRLLELCRDPAVAWTPVCISYSTDTVGGNSGSPVLDADGRFVGINFDRQRLGLANEFKWSREFSRSIGTDVRYILWLVGTYDGAAWLVDELAK